jgi:hypothetical protein
MAQAAQAVTFGRAGTESGLLGHHAVRSLVSISFSNNHYDTLTIIDQLQEHAQNLPSDCPKNATARRERFCLFDDFYFWNGCRSPQL